MLVGSWVCPRDGKALGTLRDGTVLCPDGHVWDMDPYTETFVFKEDRGAVDPASMQGIYFVR